MLVFIDESGDNGLHLLTGSSKNLIITLVLFEDHAEALRADERIANLRRELGLNAGFEFHFSKLKQEWRERFLRAVGVFDFLYFSIVIDKAEIGAVPSNLPNSTAMPAILPSSWLSRT